MSKKRSVPLKPRSWRGVIQLGDDGVPNALFELPKRRSRACEVVIIELGRGLYLPTQLARFVAAARSLGKSYCKGRWWQKMDPQVASEIRPMMHELIRSIHGIDKANGVDWMGQ